MQLRAFLLLPALLLFTHATPIHRRDASSDLVDALNSKGQFSTLTGWLKDNPDIIKTVMQSPGPKTLFAPTDAAAAPLPDVVRNDKNRLEATLLYHVLNGSFDLNNLASANNLHTIGHSLLTSSDYVNLPGNNGLPVAMQKDPSTSEKQLVEGSNVDGFDGDSFQYNKDGLDLTIQPIKRMLSVPGNVTFTLGYHGGYDRIVEMIRSIGGLGSTLDNMQGVTIFAPNDQAVNQFLSGANGSISNVNDNTISTVVMQHVVSNRVVFSPLLTGQGSIINAAGQDLVYDQDKNVVTVGNWSARVLQTDLMAKGGVVHLIDSVLGSTVLDQNRASQASESAKNSAKAGISGPVTAQNAATSQGQSVPGPDSNNKADGYKNSTVSGDGSGSGNNNSSGSNGNKKGQSSSSTVLLTSSAFVGLSSIVGLVLLF